MAALAWALRLRECLAPGSESHTRSNKGLHAKYAALICTAPLGEAVAMAHRVEASSNRRAVAAMRVGLEACVDRSIGIRAPPFRNRPSWRTRSREARLVHHSLGLRPASRVATAEGIGAAAPMSRSRLTQSDAPYAYPSGAVAVPRTLADSGHRSPSRSPCQRTPRPVAGG